MRRDFKKQNNEEQYYSLIDDYELIESSFAQQYGIRLRKEDEMSWDEFTALLSGINGETPLGYMVRIRAEKDPKRIKEFTPEERKIRAEWQYKQNQNKPQMSKEELNKQMKLMAEAFTRAFGKGTK